MTYDKQYRLTPRWDKTNRIDPIITHYDKEELPMAEMEVHPTGAKRGTDLKNQKYFLMSPVAIRRYAEVMAEGAGKYGNYNWEKGFPISDLLDHALAHIFNFLDGDRSEDHLGHALWNICGAVHSEERWPELNTNLRPVTTEPEGEIYHSYDGPSPPEKAEGECGFVQPVHNVRASDLFDLPPLGHRDPDTYEFVENKSELESLRKFKAYVHQRLDEAGIPKQPNGVHTLNGCRIGDRLDLVLPITHSLKARVAMIHGGTEIIHPNLAGMTTEQMEHSFPDFYLHDQYIPSGLYWVVGGIDTDPADAKEFRLLQILGKAVYRIDVNTGTQGRCVTGDVTRCSFYKNTRFYPVDAAPIPPPAFLQKNSEVVE